MAIIRLLLILFALPALAHDGKHDDWFKTLSSQGGALCCDGTDALKIEDPDWKVGPDGYQVRLDGEWIDVPPDRVVTSRNIVGVAFVWPYYLDGKQVVRCFLAGSGA